MDGFNRVTYAEYAQFRTYIAAGTGKRAKIIAESLSPVEQFEPGDAHYMSLENGNIAGYIIRNEEELVGVFSLMAGQGCRLIASAIASGARRLDCFDGYLPAFYGRHGFVETRREANWVKGEPDVVYMEIPPVEFSDGCNSACRDTAILNAIAELMSGNEWDSDTMSTIAELISTSGRFIAEPES